MTPLPWQEVTTLTGPLSTLFIIFFLEWPFFSRTMTMTGGTILTEASSSTSKCLIPWVEGRQQHISLFSYFMVLFRTVYAAALAWVVSSVTFGSSFSCLEKYTFSECPILVGGESNGRIFQSQRGIQAELFIGISFSSGTLGTLMKLSSGIWAEILRVSFVFWEDFPVEQWVLTGISQAEFWNDFSEKMHDFLEVNPKRISSRYRDNHQKKKKKHWQNFLEKSWHD